MKRHNCVCFTYWLHVSTFKKNSGLEVAYLQYLLVLKFRRDTRVSPHLNLANTAVKSTMFHLNNYSMFNVAHVLNGTSDMKNVHIDEKRDILTYNITYYNLYCFKLEFCKFLWHILMLCGSTSLFSLMFPPQALDNGVVLFKIR